MKSLAFALALAAGLALADSAPPPDKTLIPRELLVGDPERTSPEISPDGRRLAWLAPDANNVLQIWVKGLAQKDAEAVAFTHDKKRPIRTYGWAPDSQSLLYLQDADGDENYHLYGVLQ